MPKLGLAHDRKGARNTSTALPIDTQLIGVQVRRPRGIQEPRLIISRVPVRTICEFREGRDKDAPCVLQGVCRGAYGLEAWKGRSLDNSIFLCQHSTELLSSAWYSGGKPLRQVSKYRRM